MNAVTASSTVPFTPCNISDNISMVQPGRRSEKMKNSNLDKHLKVREDKCIHCGRCVEICWNGVLKLNERKVPEMCIDRLTDEWHMCWECQRCMAGCPTGALSILDKNPDDLPARTTIPSPGQMDALIQNRRSCRKFKQQNVDKDLIRHILYTVGNSPTGSCNQIYEFTVIDDINVMREFTTILRDEMLAETARGNNPPRFDDGDMAMIRSCYEKGEEFCFRGAPHLLAVHAPIGKGEWVFDTAIALAYTELEMTCNDLGFIYVSTPWAALQICPRSRAFLQIPENHYISCLVGFGYPAYQFPRGVDRSGVLKINRITGEKTKELISRH